PPPNIRLSMIISTSVAYLVRRESEEPIKKLDSILAEVVPTIEKVYALWTSTPVNDIGIRTTMDDRTAEYTGVLLAHWKTLRPQLLPLVRGGNLAD
ncbi:MAG TPA: hypothetical protein VHP80_21235, partial [Candidatus Acidoferrum sp.]|nr:hypothetical protein [Candidatus Acidoferrum sp.]